MVMFKGQDGESDFYSEEQIGQNDGQSEVELTRSPNAVLHPGDEAVLANRSKMGKDGQCPICHRLHDIDKPCPKRIANALLMRPKGFENLTVEDRAWLIAYLKNVNLDDIVEERIAGLLLY